jgi:hypothetical protein
VKAGRSRPLILALTGTLSLFLLAGCTPGPEPVETPTASAVMTAPPSAAPTPTTPPAAALVPEGTAEENFPFFTDVVTSVWQGPDKVAGRAYVDALTAAGFDRGAMQLTPDKTTVGDPVESLQFSVRWGGECLLGQVWPGASEPVTTIGTALSGDICLLGDTRPIDW